MNFFNGFMEMLTSEFGPLGPLYALGLVGFILVLGTIPFMLGGRGDPFAKLDQKKRAEDKAKKNELKKPQLRAAERGPNLDKYKTFLEPQDQESFSKVRLKLIQAGYRQKSAVRTFHFAQMALGLGGLFFGILYALFGLQEPTSQSMLMAILVPAGGGYYLPTYWTERRRQTRQTAMTEGFPDALDLMLVCVEAGQSLDQSIQRVAAEIKPGFPELSEEFEIVANEMRAGKDRISVLRDMAERVGAADISAFVTVLIQSASFGTSISEALRVYAAEMRDKRVMRAEEKANVLPTKLTLGTMMFTLPPLMIILIGPSIYDIYLTLAAGK